MTTTGKSRALPESRVDNYWKVVSTEKAPIKRNSFFMIILYILCGVGRDQGAGRGTDVRRMYSLPAGGGKSGTVAAECRLLASL